MQKKTIASVAAGIVVGAVLALIIGGALITVEGLAVETKANGWVTFPECGRPGINILEQAMCAAVLPAANLPQEAVYWQTATDGAGHRLNGQNNYIMQFPSGGLPPNVVFGR